MTPIQALQFQADKCPEQVAFIIGSDVWTYRRLAMEVERLAQALRARGLHPGHRVALHMANLPELVVAYYACFRVGAIAAPLNTRFKTAELRTILKRLQPALYLGQAEFFPQVAALEPDILDPCACFVVRGPAEDGRAQSWARLFKGTARSSIQWNPDVDAPAVLLTTSGTTGDPKFVAHTAASLSARANWGRHIGLDGLQTVLNALPMVHAAGLSLLLACVRFAVPMILLERFEAAVALDAIETYRCSWMLGMPYMFSEMLKRQRAQARKATSLRLCLTAGDICPLALQQAFSEIFGAPLCNLWGCIEASGSLIHGLQPGAVSRVAPGAQVRLIDGSGSPVARGEIGELAVRGPHVAIGYWVRPGRIDDPTSDGWFRTGDLMRQGEGDDLWFVGRKKDLIVRGGSNIAPIEVERVLITHPAVRDAAVVGIPDVILGQRVVAFVQLAEDACRAAVRDILASAKEQLADYKVPERMVIVEEIPRNALGKVNRTALLPMLAVRGA